MPGPDVLLILIVILLIVLLARGPKVLPEIGTSLGQMIRGFRESVKDPDEAKSSPTDQPAGPSAPGQGGPGNGPGNASGGPSGG
ncbi:MAG TPA: twin-arginine translocase TatA/TatE family subunit [Candidatus Limnocylindrales bacterium]|nr:twin-arginine translocase TatA/TatE family subunit [Candidatus Limnocylindrales bacterium]